MRPKKKRKEHYKYIKQDNWCGQAAGRGIFLRQLWEDFSSQTEATVDVRFSLRILFVIITGEIALGPGFLWLSQSLFLYLISVIVIIHIFAN